MNISDFIKKDGRTLPVFLLIDVSGSMKGEKIETVNVALKEMLNQFRKIANPKGIIELCILTFGNDQVKSIKDLSILKDTDHYVFDAEGNTPMGKAFETVTNLIEDYQVVSSRSYVPTIILISDGNPTDFPGYSAGMDLDQISKWDSMKLLHSGKRTSKAVKTALGIGNDVDMNILKAFINNDTVPVIKANDIQTINKYFQWVTMSISVRSLSANPNQGTMVTPDLFDNESIEF